jgi:alpha-L-fucosidase
MLIGCAGGDGNLLLNVGPMPNGEIPPDQANRLKEIGTWLAKYGESIYGTRGGPFKPGDYGASTRKGSTIFLHIREWDEEVLKLPPISARVLRSRVLSGGKVEFRQTAAGLEVSVPQSDRQRLYTIVALELDGEANLIPAMTVPGPLSLTLKARANASNVYRNQAEYGPEKAVDGLDETRWATDSGIKAAWLEVDLGKSVTFDRVVVKQAYPELGRIRRFTIEYLADNHWKPCYEGQNLGAKLTARFAPVSARQVRLNITEATDGPTVTEFKLFPPTSQSTAKAGERE